VCYDVVFLASVRHYFPTTVSLMTQ